MNKCRFHRAVVWSGTFDVLERASHRYSADAMLIGRVSRGRGRFVDGAWQMWTRADKQRFKIESASPPRRVPQSSTVSSNHSSHVTSSTAVRNSAEVRVDGIANVSDYGALLAYLAGLEFVDAVEVDEVSPGVVHAVARERVRSGTGCATCSRSTGA